MFIESKIEQTNYSLTIQTTHFQVELFIIIFFLSIFNSWISNLFRLKTSNLNFISVFQFDPRFVFTINWSEQDRALPSRWNVLSKHRLDRWLRGFAKISCFFCRITNTNWAKRCVALLDDDERVIHFKVIWPLNWLLFQQVSSYRVKMRLKIKKVENKDYGAYKCVAKNTLGEKEGYIRLYSKCPDRQGSQPDLAEQYWIAICTRKRKRVAILKRATLEMI